MTAASVRCQNAPLYEFYSRSSVFCLLPSFSTDESAPSPGPIPLPPMTRMSRLL